MRIEREKLNRWLCCFLVLMMPFSWVNIVFGSVYRLVILAVFALYLLNNRFRVHIAKECMPVFIAWTLYTGYTLLTAFWTKGTGLNVENAMGMVLLYVMSLTFLTITYDEVTKRMLEMCWLIATIFLALMFLFGETMQLGYLERRTLIILGTATDANEFASFFIVGFCVTLNMFLKEKRTLFKLLLVAVALMVVYVVLMAASRGALLAMIIAAVVTLFVGLKDVPAWKVLGFTLAGIVVVVLAGIVVFPFIPQANLDRMMISTILEDAGSGRSGIWESAWNSFISGDVWRMLLGYGYGRFEVGVIEGVNSTTMMMHNQFVQQLISYGLVGLVLYVTFVWQCFRSFWRRFREYFGIFIGITAMSMTLTMGPSYKILWIVLFMALMQYSGTTEEETSSPLQRG